MMIKTNSVRVFFLKFTLLILLLYNCHRYLLKYNSESTSPTYSNTPFLWKISKYILITVGLIGVYAFSRYRVKGSKVAYVSLCIIALLLVVNVVSFVIYDKLIFDEFEYLFFFIVLYPFFFINEETLIYVKSNMDKALLLATYFCVMTNIYVILNFYLTGRLPALAWEGILVRFGGLWDDPNAFGFICVFLFFVNFLKKRYVLSFALLGSIFFSFSLSAFALFLAAIIYWSGLSGLRINRRLLYFFVPVLFVIGYVALSHADQIVRFVQIKSGSIRDHSKFEILLSPVPLMQPMQFHETWLLSFLVNYFPLSLVVLIYFGVLLYNSFIRTKKSPIDFYIFLFICGNLFLPFFYMFPLNFVFILFLIINIRLRYEAISC